MYQSFWASNKHWVLREKSLPMPFSTIQSASTAFNHKWKVGVDIQRNIWSHQTSKYHQFHGCESWKTVVLLLLNYFKLLLAGSPLKEKTAMKNHHQIIFFWWETCQGLSNSLCSFWTATTFGRFSIKRKNVMENHHQIIFFWWETCQGLSAFTSYWTDVLLKTTAMTNTKTSKIGKGNEEYLHSSVAFVEAIIKNQILKRHNFPIPGIMPALDLASIFSYYLKKI